LSESLKSSAQLLKGLQKFILFGSLTLFAFLGAAGFSFAQKFEIGGYVAGVNYYGDIHPLPTTRSTQLGASLFGKANLNPYWGFRAGIFTGSIAGYDSLSNNSFQQNRRLSFESSVRELYGAVEFNFFKYIPNDDDAAHFTPFLYSGFGFTRVNPTTRLGVNSYSLIDAGTEGQDIDGTTDKDKPINRAQPFFLIGGGLKYNISGFFTLGLDIGVRKTYSDYLDDVSTIYADNKTILKLRGEEYALLADPNQTQPNTNPYRQGDQRGLTSNNDWYYSAGLSLIYTLPASSCPQFR